MKDALLRDDGADQEGNQQNDRHRLPTDAVEMMYRGSQPERVWPSRHPAERDRHGAQHAHKNEQVLADLVDRPPDRLQGIAQLVFRPQGRGGLDIGVLHLLDQPAVMLRQTNDARLLPPRRALADQPLQQPGAVGIELAHVTHVDGDAAHARLLLGDRVDQRLQVAGIVGGPSAGGSDVELLAVDLAAQQWFAVQDFTLRPRRVDYGAYCRSSLKHQRLSSYLTPHASVEGSPSIRQLLMPNLVRPRRDQYHSRMPIDVTIKVERWPVAGAFTIARGSRTETGVVVAELSDGRHHGRGECVPYARYGETVEGVVAAIEAMREALGGGLDRAALQQTMPFGAGRNALDCAFWDLEAKRSGQPVHILAGLPPPRPLITAYT